MDSSPGILQRFQKIFPWNNKKEINEEIKPLEIKEEIKPVALKKEIKPEKFKEEIKPLEIKEKVKEVIKSEEDIEDVNDNKVNYSSEQIKKIKNNISCQNYIFNQNKIYCWDENKFNLYKD